MEKLVIDNNTLFGNVVELLRQGKKVTIPVKGTSMLPFIRENRDLVILEGVEAASPDGKDRIHVKPGDIVLFRYQGRYILHRIVNICNGEAHIQGDGILKNQEHCGMDQIFGRVVTILRNQTKNVDPYSKKSIRLLSVWNIMKPVRRYLLAVYRRLPWNR